MLSTQIWHRLGQRRATYADISADTDTLGPLMRAYGKSIIRFQVLSVSSWLLQWHYFVLTDKWFGLRATLDKHWSWLRVTQFSAVAEALKRVQLKYDDNPARASVHTQTNPPIEGSYYGARGNGNWETGRLRAENWGLAMEFGEPTR